MKRSRSVLLLLACIVPLLAVAFVASGCTKGDEASAPSAPSAPYVVPPTGGAVAITADAKGFTPAEVRATKGAPLTLVFTRTSDNTCAKEVVFPELKIRRPLPMNEPVAVELQTTNDHTYRFQCGMAMWEGAVVVK